MIASCMTTETSVIFVVLSLNKTHVLKAHSVCSLSLHEACMRFWRSTGGGAIKHHSCTFVLFYTPASSCHRLCTCTLMLLHPHALSHLWFCALVPCHPCTLVASHTCTQCPCTIAILCPCALMHSHPVACALL